MKQIIFFLILLTSFSIQANPTCSINGTRIIYTNGISTSEKDARRSLDFLYSYIIKSDIDSKFVLDPELAFNHDANLGYDLLEAAVQRFPPGFLRAKNVTNSYAAYKAFTNGDLASGLYNTALSAITSKIIELQVNWLATSPVSTEYNITLNKVKNHYSDAFARNERIFAISHSQGGLFMQDAFEKLQNPEKYKLFSGFQIASPLKNEMNSHFGYATYTDDLVINGIRVSIGALPGNISSVLMIVNHGDLEGEYKDLILNHGIRTTYLNDQTLRKQVLTKLKVTAQLLESNCPKAVINFTKNNLQANFNSTDPENSEISGVIYNWNFGDNSKTETTSKTINHTYSSTGKYLVTLALKDSAGNMIDSTTREITIEQAVPNRMVYYFANRDVMFGFEGSLTTSGLNLNYSWDFGDGMKAETTGVATIHKYSNEGTYPITLTISADNTFLGTIKTNIKVTDVVRSSLCSENLEDVKKVISPTSILGFIGQFDGDPRIGRCYVKNFNSFVYNNLNCFNLYNCSAYDLIP